ncbi:RDD family protein [Oceanospirillum maris]|uniref:RDD family protein n=1 Tax=Oceanospirillum maris TaxID=64977 RepID=UPI0006842D3A|nr:RDD family protein [Oceanospirillum maris]
MTTSGRQFPNQAYTRPAGLVRRLGAMMYDFLIIVAIWMLLGFARLPFLDQGVDAMNDRAGPGFQSLLFLITFGFFAFFWLRTGQTLGMLAWRIRIQNANGHSISMTQALMRFFSGAFSLICLGLGHFWMLFTPAKQTWPDRFSDSEVVYVPSDKEIKAIQAESDLTDKPSLANKGKKPKKS